MKNSLQSIASKSCRNSVAHIAESNLPKDRQSIQVVNMAHKVSFARLNREHTLMAETLYYNSKWSG